VQKLFIYGTLRDANLRYALIGKKASTIKGTLKGFALDSIGHEDKVYPIIYRTGVSKDLIEGEILDVDENDLLLFDKYEGDGYRRIMVELEEGTKAWVYAK